MSFKFLVFSFKAARVRKSAVFSRAPQPRRGFTLLLAALVASLLSSLGLAMFAIAQKELILSSIGRDSQLAFYAADTGAECALYWDFHDDVFNVEAVYDTPDDPAKPEARCNGNILADFPTPWDTTHASDGITGLGGGNVSSFWFDVSGDGSRTYCVYVTVEKVAGSKRTIVESLGYSTPCNDPTNTRRLERAVRMQF